MPRLTITDDGDEALYFDLDGERIFEANHDEDGWAGMTRLRDAFTILAGHLGAEIHDSQDVV